MKPTHARSDDSSYLDNNTNHAQYRAQHNTLRKTQPDSPVGVHSASRSGARPGGYSDSRADSKTAHSVSHTAKRGRGSAARRRKSSSGTGIAWAVICLALGLMVFSVGLAGLAVTNSGRIYPGLTLRGITLGQLTVDEAVQTLEAQGWSAYASQTLEIRLPYDKTCSLTYSDAGLRPTTQQAVELAYAYGRSGTWYGNLLRYVICSLKTTELQDLYCVLDETALDEAVTQCAESVGSADGNSAYTIDTNLCELQLVKGQGSLQLDEAATEEQIRSALLQGQTELEITALTGEAERPDFTQIYAEVCAEMKDASFSTDGSHTILPETVGYAFDVTQAETLWDAAAPATLVSIPLTITQPSVTAEMLEENLYAHLLGAMTTKYNNSGENRCSNVRLAASLINETILFPGEEFSYNDVVGVRTEERGFLPAPAYAGYDDIKEEIGGGICQVSSTLYAATLFSFLEVKSHTSHIYPPNYIQLGLDATVTIPEGGGRTIDYKFVNSKNYPIKIVAYCEETVKENGYPFKTVTVEIWGTLEDDDFMPIEFDNSYADIYDYDRVIEPAYPDREGYKIKFTHEESEFEDDTGKGLRTLTHRKVFDSDGNLVQDHIINPTYSAGYALDTYYYHG